MKFDQAGPYTLNDGRSVGRVVVTLGDLATELAGYADRHPSVRLHTVESAWLVERVVAYESSSIRRGDVLDDISETFTIRCAQFATVGPSELPPLVAGSPAPAELARRIRSLDDPERLLREPMRLVEAYGDLVNGTHRRVLLGLERDHDRHGLITERWRAQRALRDERVAAVPA